ncbi:MAG: DUF4339 domain-containing protein [Gemmataceae bacterium]|nr:DUF4339 domain-containing protein [Gemmataceae bacterium]
MPPADSQWYYSVGGQRFGPVPASELKSLATAGKLAGGDLVWKEGMTDWAPAKKVKGLIPPPGPSGPPPLPQVGLPEAPLDLPPDDRLEGSGSMRPARSLERRDAELELTQSRPDASPPLIAGLHRQRFGVVVAAGAGMLATFLPWFHAPIVGAVYGAAGPGWKTLVLFTPAVILALVGDQTRAVVGIRRLGAVIPAGIATLIGLRMLANISSRKGRIERGDSWEAMTELMGGVQPGAGLYLLVIAGIALVAFAWLLARPSTSRRTRS